MKALQHKVSGLFKRSSNGERMFACWDFAGQYDPEVYELVDVPEAGPAEEDFEPKPVNKTEALIAVIQSFDPSLQAIFAEAISKVDSLRTYGLEEAALAVIQNVSIPAIVAQYNLSPEVEAAITDGKAQILAVMTGS
jgi:hypothetical protein